MAKMAVPTFSKPHSELFFSISKPPPTISTTVLKPFSIQTLPFSKKSFSITLSVSLNPPAQPTQTSESEEEVAIGDCLVFEEGAFEDPYLQQNEELVSDNSNNKPIRSKVIKKAEQAEQESLVPGKWAEAVAEYNISKKERRRIMQQIEHGSRIERKNRAIPVKNTQEFLSYREFKLAQLKPRVLDDPEYYVDEVEGEEGGVELECSSSGGRVVGKNPRLEVYGRGLEDISEFFTSGDYVPGEKKSAGRRKLFTKEEKVLLNKRVPNLADATSEKWLPLHTLAASGEFYLVDALLKHNVDINAADRDGLTALHRAITCKKQAVTNYLLRESANPFIRDKDGATLMHYAVQTASIPTIKLLLLYNVNINLTDDFGWTPLHLAVQTRRIDLVKLLLIKGADKTLRNQDGLTPIDLCLYSGRHVRTYELIRLLKQPSRSQQSKQS